MEPGGWLYKCGHFHPSTFVQIAQCQGECYDCKYAKKLLEQAKHLRRRKETAEPSFKVTPVNPLHDPPKKRFANCQMSY